MAITVWSMLDECVGLLDEPFRRSEIVGWFRRHYPDVNEATLGAHIQAATANATNRARNNALGRRSPLIERIDHGLYVRARRSEPSALGAELGHATRLAPAAAVDGDIAVILVGCVKSKQATAAPAGELYVSPLFDGRRQYALDSGLPWYILSAKFGLLAPDDVIGPYDVYLAEQSTDYRKTWGEFVAARGISLAAPLTGLELGRQVAWYQTRASAWHPESASPRVSVPPRPEQPEELADASHLISKLTDSSRMRSPQELVSGGSNGLLVPGLYSWWVDETGAADLSAGLGLPLRAGLIYAGQADATRWPSGKRSAGTLWERLTQMHLGGSAEFSTFRRTLAAILRPVLRLAGETDPQLSAWISAHLRVVAVPVADADRLGDVESAVLDALDPPLNIMGRPGTPVRARLTELRHDRNTQDDAHAMANPQDSSSTRTKPPQNQAEQQFHRAMAGIYETAKRELGYTAARFLHMISDKGGLATARQLVWSDTPSDGFTTLWQHNRLDLTVEAHVLKPEFADLFTDDDRQRARERLELYGWRPRAS